MVKRDCNKNLTFEEKELELLRASVDIAGNKLGAKIKQKNDIDDIIKVLEDFMQRKKVVCYGGTAINNILPANEQFYNKDIEIPDYDFYSPKALKHSRELADLYAKLGYNEIEVRSGVHKETYKLFINFIPIADITQFEPKIFKILLKSAIRKEGIYYAPPDYLRLQIYNELSRPHGDVTRWEKIYKRLILLNKHYPFKENPKCSQVNFMRDFTGNPEFNESLYNIVKETMIDEGVVFIGGYASSLYGRHMPPEQKKQLQHVPDFDVLAEDPKAVAYIVKEKLEDAGFKNVKVNTKPPVGNEIIMVHYEITVDEDTLCFIYKPLGCYSYNTIQLNKKTVKVATIDTMLLFLLAFIYADRPYYDHERIMCMAQYLINVQSKNRLEQKGLLKRFITNCYGNEKTIIEIRSEKAEKYLKLKNENNFREFDKYFYKYTPEKYRPDEEIKIKKKDIKMLVSDEIKPKHKYKRTKKIKNKGYFKTKKNGIKNVFGKFF
jgi:hypothetical protein